MKKELEKTADEALENVAGGFKIKLDANFKDGCITRSYKLTKAERKAFAGKENSDEYKHFKAEASLEQADLDTLLKKGKVEIKEYLYK